jgi:hypothetical protein
LARLYADENFPQPAAEALRRLGHDVLTSREAAQAGLAIPDHEVLAFAHSHGRAVLTHNRKHFRNLHNAGSLHSGMIICTEDVDFDSLAMNVHDALSRTGELSGALVRVVRSVR